MPAFILIFVVYFMITNPTGAADIVGEVMDLISRFFEAVIVFFDQLL